MSKESGIGLGWRVLRWLPHGVHVRRLVALLLLSLGLVRVTGWGDQMPQLDLWDARLYGGLSVVCGILLLVSRRQRLGVWGRGVATGAFSLCMMLAVDFAPLLTGLVVYGVLGLALLGELSSAVDGC